MSTPNHRTKLVIIGAAAFDRNYYRRKITDIFIIYEIDSKINHRKLAETQYNNRILEDSPVL